ncbi:taurine catabolism dioxygenase, partial [Rhodococcus erythropolis]|nr:taurine catabolism dioxygenase [Rhodococcus erythropolis]
AGDIPVNIHGERSRSIAGDASEYSVIEGAVAAEGASNNS